MVYCCSNHSCHHYRNYHFINNRIPHKINLTVITAPAADATIDSIIDIVAQITSECFSSHQQRYIGLTSLQSGNPVSCRNCLYDFRIFCLLYLERFPRVSQRIQRTFRCFLRALDVFFQFVCRRREVIPLAARRDDMTFPSHGLHVDPYGAFIQLREADNLCCRHCITAPVRDQPIDYAVRILIDQHVPTPSSSSFFWRLSRSLMSSPQDSYAAFVLT